MKRRKLIAGNWKMNGLKAASLAMLWDLLQRQGEASLPADIVICPPVTLLDSVGQLLAGSRLLLGAQDCHSAGGGAFTGDVSASQLADLGAAFVIVGHSERRAQHGETDSLVKAKAEAVLAAEMTAIICVGETEAERASGRALEVVAGQALASLPDQASATSVIIAYEPVWAIGSGRTPTTAEVQEIHAALRQRLAGRLGKQTAALRILYGGSVKPANSKELLTLPDVDGGLIGGASLDAEAFWAIALATSGAGA